MITISCPQCGTNNRIREDTALVRQPVCGRCRAKLGTGWPEAESEVVSSRPTARGAEPVPQFAYGTNKADDQTKQSFNPYEFAPAPSGGGLKRIASFVFFGVAIVGGLIAFFNSSSPPPPKHSNKSYSDLISTPPASNPPASSAQSSAAVGTQVTQPAAPYPTAPPVSQSVQMDVAPRRNLCLQLWTTSERLLPAMANGTPGAMTQYQNVQQEMLRLRCGEFMSPRTPSGASGSLVGDAARIEADIQKQRMVDRVQQAENLRREEAIRRGEFDPTRP